MMIGRGPELHAARAEEPLARALRLAREIEVLLAEAEGDPRVADRASLRMAHAVASSLVSELQHAADGDRPSLRVPRA